MAKIRIYISVIAPELSMAISFVRNGDKFVDMGQLSRSVHFGIPIHSLKKY
jgi:hypothetical protein